MNLLDEVRHEMAIFGSLDIKLRLPIGWIGVRCESEEQAPEGGTKVRRMIRDA